MLVNNIVLNNTSTQSTQFKAFKLQGKTYKEANALIKNYAQNLPEKELILIKDKIFSLINNYLQKFAKQKTKAYQDYNNILQRMYLMFFEALEQFKNEDNPIDIIIEKVNEFRHNADDNSTGYFSLGKVPGKSLTQYNDLFLTDATVEEPLSGNYRQQKKAKEELKKIEELPELTEENILLLQKRSKGKLYKDIGKEIGVSKVKAREKILDTIAKVQDVSGVGTADFTQTATELKNRLGLKKDVDKIKKLVVKFLCLREKSIDFLDTNSTNIAKALEIEKERFTNSAIEQPQTMLLKPETILKNITEAAKLLNISKEQYIEAALKQPALMYQNPQTIFSKVKKACKLMNVSKEEFIKTALRTPTMFYQNPETLARKTNIITYYKKVQNLPVNKLKSISLKSDNKLFSNILKYLIAQQTGEKFDYTYREDDLIEYLKNNVDKDFKIKLLPDDIVNDFIKYSTDLSEKICGRNIFEFMV